MKDHTNNIDAREQSGEILKQFLKDFGSEDIISPLGVAQNKLEALITQEKKALLADIRRDIEACDDCPTDESPTIHLLKYEAKLKELDNGN